MDMSFMKHLTKFAASMLACTGVSAARWLAGLAVLCAVPAASGAVAPPHSLKLAESYGRLPVVFEPNRGQADTAAEFIARGSGYRVWIGREETAIALTTHGSRKDDSTSKTDVLRMRFVGAAADASVVGERLLESHSNYFIGADPTRHLTGIPHFASVRRAGIYPGIDVLYYGNQRQLEYDLIVSPGANLDTIKVAFEGARRLSVDKDGNLIVQAAHGRLVQYRPHVFQVVDGERKRVAGRYRLHNGVVGFKIGRFDRSRPLVIDPVISYASYLGGTAFDAAAAIAVDTAGNAYLAGRTTSSGFPGLNGFDRQIGSSDQDVFVTKFNATGSGIVYSTYLGAAKDNDFATGIAVDGAFNAYVVGWGGSSFPTTAGAYQTTSATGGSFVTKLNPAGTGLAYSTYVNGTDINGVAVDGLGQAVVAGDANATFVATAGAYQRNVRAPNGYNAFVAKFNTGGTALVYGTFLGGSVRDQAYAVALDGSGNAYVTGYTASPDFPVVNPFQAQYAGPAGYSDAFVAKLNSAGSVLLYSTFLGGDGDDVGNGIAVDGEGFAYVTGETHSTNFPVANAFQATKGGIQSTNTRTAFLTKLAPSGNSLVYSSYHGGSRDEIGEAVAVDANGNAYFVGSTSSTDFPVLNPILPDKRRGTRGAYVTKVAPSGYRFYSILISGSGGTIGDALTSGELDTAIASDVSSGIYLAGRTDSSDFPSTTGAFQRALSFDSRKGIQPDAFALKLTSPAYSVTLTSANNNIAANQAATLTSTITLSGGPTPTGSVMIYDGAAFLASLTLSNGTASGPISGLPVGVHRLTSVYAASGDGSSSRSLYQGINQIPCNGTAPPQSVPANAPVVVLKSPSNCLLAAGGTLTVEAEAGTSNGRISSVQFFASGASIGTSTAAPYRISWTPSSVVATYDVTAVATDSAGTSTTSAPIRVTIDPPPAVHITAPTGGSFPVGTNVTVTATASDQAGGSITLVEFLQNGSLIGSTNAAPYSVVWVPGETGPHTLTARATDNAGNIAPSDNAPVVTITNAPPTVRITAPANDASFDAPANITLTAEASDTGGSVSLVQFYKNGVLIDAGTQTSPGIYTLAWSNVGPGTYSLTAVATDNGGAQTTSAAVTVKVAMHTDAGETVVFLHNDFAGNTIAATDTTGALLWKENYKPFGDRVRNDPAAASNRQWFAGKAADTDTGLSYFGARYYDPVVGRFMGIDPKGFDDADIHSFSRYGYGNNNPYRFKDPDGRTPLDLVFVAIDLVRLGHAVATGGDVGGVGIDLAISAGSVFLPIPGASLAIKAERAASSAKAIEHAAEAVLTNSETRHQALNQAKRANDIPLSKQPDQVIKPNTKLGDEVGLDASRNVRQYEYTNSKGQGISIREDRPHKYPDGGSQGPHFNAGPSGGDKLRQHHNFDGP